MLQLPGWQRRRDHPRHVAVHHATTAIAVARLPRGFDGEEQCADGDAECTGAVNSAATRRGGPHAPHKWAAGPRSVLGRCRAEDRRERCRPERIRRHPTRLGFRGRRRVDRSKLILGGLSAPIPAVADSTLRASVISNGGRLSHLKGLDCSSARSVASRRLRARPREPRRCRPARCI